MTKMINSSCVIAALLCMTMGNAIAEDTSATPQAETAATTSSTPDATNSQNNQSKPKEEAASTKPSQGSETKAAEPECN